MDNRNVLDIGSIISDINLGTATKIGKAIHERISNQEEEELYSSQTAEYEDKGPIGDYDTIYQEVCHILEIIKQKWGVDDTDSNMLNTFYQRDLLYLYDRITLDMEYLSDYPERNSEWLDKLLELKYEIRNLF